MILFQSTQPKRAATYHANGAGEHQPYFNPRSPRGLRRSFFADNRPTFLFQSTQPKRAATCAAIIAIMLFFDFNPRSPRGLRLVFSGIYVYQYVFQSTQPKRAATVTSRIMTYPNSVFQSTQPKRAATESRQRRKRKKADFNPRSPRGLRLCVKSAMITLQSFQSTQPKRAATEYIFFNRKYKVISIHAAQEGCDPRRLCGAGVGEFQSTQPKRAATISR